MRSNSFATSSSSLPLAPLDLDLSCESWDKWGLRVDALGQNQQRNSIRSASDRSSACTLQPLLTSRFSTTTFGTLSSGWTLLDEQPPTWSSSDVYSLSPANTVTASSSPFWQAADDTAFRTPSLTPISSRSPTPFFPLSCSPLRSQQGSVILPLPVLEETDRDQASSNLTALENELCDKLAAFKLLGDSDVCATGNSLAIHGLDDYPLRAADLELSDLDLHLASFDRINRTPSNVLFPSAAFDQDQDQDLTPRPRGKSLDVKTIMTLDTDVSDPFMRETKRLKTVDDERVPGLLVYPEEQDLVSSQEAIFFDYANEDILVDQIGQVEPSWTQDGSHDQMDVCDLALTKNIDGEHGIMAAEDQARHSIESLVAGSCAPASTAHWVTLSGTRRSI